MTARSEQTTVGLAETLMNGCQHVTAASILPKDIPTEPVTSTEPVTVALPATEDASDLPWETVDQHIAFIRDR